MANNEDLGPFMIRIVLGLIFLIPGVLKLLNPSMIIGMISGAGLPLATLQGWLVILGEIVGGLGLLLGFRTKWTVWPPVPIMLGAIVLAVIPAGGDFMLINVLFHVLAAVGCVSIYFTGPGRFALDL